MGKIIKNGIVYGGGGGGGTGGHTILDTDGNPMPAEVGLQFTGLDVQDNSTDSETEVAAFGLNVDSLDDVMSAGTAGNQVAGNGLVYSTTEQVVGRWVDGKPLYQKTFVGTLPNGVNVEQDLEISTADLNIEQCISVSHCHDGSGGNPNLMTGTSGYMYPTPSAACLMVWFNGGSSSKIIARRKTDTATGIGGGSKIYITIRYTKTTD